MPGLSILIRRLFYEELNGKNRRWNQHGLPFQMTQGTLGFETNSLSVSHGPLIYYLLSTR